MGKKTTIGSRIAKCGGDSGRRVFHILGGDSPLERKEVDRIGYLAGERVLLDQAVILWAAKVGLRVIDRDQAGAEQIAETFRRIDPEHRQYGKKVA